MSSEQILAQLIALPSVSGDEVNIQQWIYVYLKGAGLDPHLVQGNVVCSVAGVNKSKALIFNSHVDTVSPGDLAAWQTPPFQATILGGKLYGLGASDMKSGVATMLALAEYFSRHKPAIDLWFHFVVQEETTGRGTRDVMSWFDKKHLQKYQEIAGILLEPTSLECIEIAHKGNIFLKLTTSGDSGHGSTPEAVHQHAVTKMITASEHLQHLVGDWTKAYSDPLLGSPTLALTSIQAGDMNSPNKIAGTCMATFDLRTTPKLHAQALELIKSYFAGEVLVDTVYDPLPCGYTAEYEHIVQVAQQITGLPASSTPGSTDMLFFTALGIPAIILGPGEKSVEHKANEYVELDKMEKVFDRMAQIVAAY